MALYKCNSKTIPALKKLRSIRNSLITHELHEDVKKSFMELESEIKKIPKDKTQEILDYIKDNNSQLDDLLHYVCENANPCIHPIPSNELLLSYNRELIDQCSLF